MIDLETHKKLMSVWPGRIYATPERVGPRLRHLEGLLPMLERMNVLELGCNAGLHAVEICRWSRVYTGIELDANYRKQFEMTMQLCDPRVSTFRTTSSLAKLMRAYETQHLNALVCCVALYLMSEEDLGILEQMLLPHMSTVIIQERVAHRERKGNTTNGLHTPKAIRKWIEKHGFSVSVYFDKTGKIFEVVGHK